MSKRELSRDYTAEEMDRGEGMLYHPAARRGTSYSPHLINGLKYVDAAKVFRRPPDLGALMENPGADASKIDWGHLERIGDGSPHRAGNPYPKHWIYDPYSGERLPVPLPPEKQPFCWPA